MRGEAKPLISGNSFDGILKFFTGNFQGITTFGTNQMVMVVTTSTDAKQHLIVQATYGV
jgi:hypothetical protein